METDNSIAKGRFIANNLGSFIASIFLVGPVVWTFFSWYYTDVITRDKERIKELEAQVTVLSSQVRDLEVKRNGFKQLLVQESELTNDAIDWKQIKSEQ